jgi:antitoxin component HigA of HigAB toxin-antitoxin module
MMKKIISALVVMFAMTMSVNAQSNDTSIFFKRIGCYLELDKYQMETVEISMDEFNEAMEALSDQIGTGKSVENIVNRHKHQMKQILNDKQYKKYEKIFDLTVRNTIEINNELKINNELLASAK